MPKLAAFYEDLQEIHAQKQRERDKENGLILLCSALIAAYFAIFFYIASEEERPVRELKTWLALYKDIWGIKKIFLGLIDNTLQQGFVQAVMQELQDKFFESLSENKEDILMGFARPYSLASFLLVLDSFLKVVKSRENSQLNVHITQALLDNKLALEKAPHSQDDQEQAISIIQNFYEIFINYE